MINHTHIEARLKRLASEDAATLLMETFPLEAANYSEAFAVMTHRSWKKSDQIRLARFYLRKMPFASARPYEVFASFMSLAVFIAVIREVLANKHGEQSFVIYHLTPILRKNIKTPSDHDLVSKFMAELEDGTASERTMNVATEV